MKTGKYIVKVRFFLRIGMISFIISACSNNYVTGKNYNVFDYVSLGAYRGIPVLNVIDIDEKEAEEQLENDLWTSIYHNAIVTGYPLQVYQDMYEYLDLETKELAKQWGTDRKEYLEIFVGMTLEEYAVDMTKSQLVLEAIVEKENIALSDKEYQQMIEEYAGEFGFDTPTEMEAAYEKKEIINFLISQKTYDYLKSQAVLKEVTQEEYQEKYNIN